MQTGYPVEFGIVGLGRMGGGLALQALEKGWRVAGYGRHGAGREFVEAGLISCRTLSGFREHLASPRAVFLYVPAGPVVDEVIDQLAGELEPGDILVDGGNSYWGDSLRRHRRLCARQIHFIDLGTSGGVTGARRGACFMAGGEPGPIRRVEPILKALAVENGYVHAGPPGAGHYTKLVHNGIEFGMLQAIAEGVALLTGYRDRLDVPGTLRCWRHGSVIRSWLVDLLEQGWREESGLDRIPPHVEDTGEVNWLVSDALRMEVPVPVMAAAVVQLAASRDGQRDWARAIAVMRHGFGGHPYGPDESIRQERQSGRVGDFYAGD
jgi:6-phosphogluconate dehydrogenase